MIMDAHVMDGINPFLKSFEKRKKDEETQHSHLATLLTSAWARDATAFTTWGYVIKRAFSAKKPLFFSITPTTYGF